MQSTSRILLIYDADGTEACHLAHDLKQFSPANARIAAVPAIRCPENVSVNFDVVAQFAWGLPYRFPDIRSGFVVHQPGIQFPLEDGSCASSLYATRIYNQEHAPEALARAQFAVAVNEDLQSFVQEHCREAYYTPPGVNTTRFTQRTPLTSGNRSRLVVGYHTPTIEHPAVSLVVNTVKESCKDFCTFQQRPARDMSERWYDSIDMLLSFEPVGSTSGHLLEAMACGRPVLATKTGNAASIVSRGGVLVDTYCDQRSAKQTASAIKQQLSAWQDRRELKRLGEQALHHVLENWSWEVLAPCWVNCLMGIC